VVSDFVFDSVTILSCGWSVSTNGSSTHRYLLFFGKIDLCDSRGIACSRRVLLLILNFFFQAEVGIRDRDVTGVQKCARPI